MGCGAQVPSSHTQTEQMRQPLKIKSGKVCRFRFRLKRRIFESAQNGKLEAETNMETDEMGEAPRDPEYEYRS